MSESEIQKPSSRSNFASRMLSKELNTRKKTSQEIKISPADAAKFARTEEAKKQESAVAS